MLVIEDQKHFDEVVAFAKQTNMFDVDAPGALKRRLDYLDNYGGDPNAVRTRLFKDWAPHSFGFVIERKTAEGEWKHWFTGRGSAPTYAVTVTPMSGWSIHT